MFLWLRIANIGLGFAEKEKEKLSFTLQIHFCVLACICSGDVLGIDL
ncbi:hypothetical protein EMIT036CA2_40364 [Chryseobacterium sp. IT-36CA2]